MKKILILALAIFWGGAAAAQHTHGSTKVPNGGGVQDVVSIHAELVAAGSTVTIHIIDENNKAAPANGFSGSVLLVSGGARETVQLVMSATSR